MPLHKVTSKSQCRRPGVTSDARGQSTSRWQNATAVSIRRGGIEDPRVRHDAEEAREHDVRQRERLVGGGQRAQPGGVAIVLGRIFAVRVDQDIQIGQLHRLTARGKAFNVVRFE
jgi:hypothetical protein